MYAYVCVFDVVQLLLYNIQSFDHNTVCNNNAHVTVQNNNECDNDNDIVHTAQTYIYGVDSANDCYDNILISLTVCNNNRAYDIVACVDVIFHNIYDLKRKKMLLQPLLYIYGVDTEYPSYICWINNDCTVRNNNECTAYRNNNDVIHDVVQCDYTSTNNNDFDLHDYNNIIIRGHNNIIIDPSSSL